LELELPSHRVWLTFANGAVGAQTTNCAFSCSGLGASTIQMSWGETAVKSVAEFIRQYRQTIVDEWLLRASHLPSAQALTRLSLRDHIPAILERLADAVDRRNEGPRPLEDLPEQHAIMRFQEGYDLRQVVAEYRMLRQVITDLYAERGDLSPTSRPTLKPLTIMHEAVDRAISEAVDQYAIERDRVRDRFIAVLGHDLRDPLNMIVFSAKALLARTEDLDANTGRMVGRMATGAERMQRMIGDLLDLARGRLGGGFTIVPTRFDARTLISRTVQEIAHAHTDRDVQCLVREAPGSFDVEWDSDRIAQVIANLVSNALIHGRDPIVIDVTDAGEDLELDVSNGGEIAAEFLPRLFDPFVSDTTSEGPTSGLRLGLYIVQQIAQAHGGTVKAESANGRTSLSVTLPRSARSVSQVPERRSGAAPPT
jgi:signal transduction histidine kinase